jgi:signal transduction histidine kinase
MPYRTGARAPQQYLERILRGAWYRLRHRRGTAERREVRGSVPRLVTLRENGHSLTFTVEDDGKGFDLATARMGARVQGMTDRMAALHGTLTVSSEPGRGTRVTGTIPV